MFSKQRKEVEENCGKKEVRIVKKKQMDKNEQEEEGQIKKWENKMAQKEGWEREEVKLE